MNWSFKNLVSDELKTHIDQKDYYPDYSDLWKPFLLSAREDTKVVIIGQDPYPTKGVADGLAFSCSKSKKIQPSLKIINKAIQRETLCQDLSTRCDLSEIAKQGVLLINSSLTIGRDKTNHFHKWHTFMVGIINQIPEDVIFMLWGNYAKNLYLPFIKNDQSLIFTSIHPQAENYNPKNIFYGKFKEVNQTLQGMNKEPIDWSK